VSWEWYEAVRGYVLHYRVTVTQSADDAGSFHGASHVITVIDVPGAWPGDIVAWLRQNYADAILDVITVTDPDMLAMVFDERVATNDRYGEHHDPARLSPVFTWPTAVEARISQRFAASPWLYRQWPNTPGHEGIDIHAPEGTDVLACAGGDVVYVDTSHPDEPSAHPYGNQVRVRHEFRDDVFRTIYAHLSEVSVQVGQRVSRGERIGASGATGNVLGEDGSHLHLSMHREGVQTAGYSPGVVDPELFLVWPDGHQLRADITLPHLYGVHEDSRGEMATLMRDAGIRGTILWTEGIGHDPDDTGGGRDYAGLTTTFGHTAIVRLNSGYEPEGTIPQSSEYANFARRCANWVERSRGCRIWVVGNEMNNPREHPAGQPITAAMYAECFDRVYAAIKSVQPDSIVVTGAIDPTNAVMGDCREYFLAMLDGLDAVDGIALHAYTHGPDPRLTVSDVKFDPGPLSWQYYNLRMFEPFMEAIPAQLTHLPVYMTEVNHLFRTHEEDFGWVDQNEGWVWSMYGCVDAWNRRGGQQIRCALLFRYPPVDAWVIRGKSRVIEDFAQAMELGYRPYVPWQGS
jgi:hypothetical protein